MIKNRDDEGELDPELAPREEIMPKVEAEIETARNAVGAAHQFAQAKAKEAARAKLDAEVLRAECATHFTQLKFEEQRSKMWRLLFVMALVLWLLTSFVLLTTT
jgi:hypothetical protein